MTDIHNFNPDWTSSPGETILDILEERKISLTDFAQQMGQTLAESKALVEGRTALTIGNARKLEEYFGASVQFWMTRDYQYRQDFAKLQLEIEQRSWLKELPVSDMIKFGWIWPVPHPKDEVTAFLDFFGVDSISDWKESLSKLEAQVAFKLSQTYDSQPASLLAWLRQGEIEANKISCSSWNKEEFRKSLGKIRKLTRIKDPNLFLPKLKDLCSACGVAVAIVRSPSGCRASGAARFISSDKALIMLSFRYLSDDHFWFSFFHEAAHLVLHDEKNLHLEGDDIPKTDLEMEANQFAENFLIPLEYHSSLIKIPANYKAIIKFANKIGISPGIVVGQLQRKKILGYSQMNFLKRRFEWAD